jgi:hypothetical protein
MLMFFIRAVHLIARFLVWLVAILCLAGILTAPHVFVASVSSSLNATEESPLGFARAFGATLQSTTATGISSGYIADQFNWFMMFLYCLMIPWTGDIFLEIYYLLLSFLSWLYETRCCWCCRSCHGYCCPNWCRVDVGTDDEDDDDDLDNDDDQSDENLSVNAESDSNEKKHSPSYRKMSKSK